MILIIEDEKSLARALELKLTRAGFSVKKALNGLDGLSVLEHSNCSLVLCDLIMPKLNGFEFLMALKTKKIKTPVVVLTNLGQPEDEKRVRDLGAVAFFIKSNTTISQVADFVSKYLKV